MLRLRTTTTLSVVALAVGIAGTHWLSGFSTGWVGPSERVAGYVPVAPRTIVPVHKPIRALAKRVVRPPPVVAAVHRTVLPPVVTATSAETPAAAPELVPVSMPPSPVSWSQMEGHLQGRVLLHLVIDGSGRVADASVAESSGDAVLDAHALASVRGWRFAVPADHPDGFSGELPMRYTSGDARVAQAP